MKIKKKDTKKTQAIPNIQVVLSLLLFFLSFSFSLCLGQKAYDPDETGFMLTYFVPGVFAVLALIDASIEYIDGKKGSMWNAIASVITGVVEAGFTLYVGVSYFAKYPQGVEQNVFKAIAFASIIILLILNVFVRNMKISGVLKRKTKQIPLIHAGFLLTSLIASAFALSAIKVHVSPYSQAIYNIALTSLIVNGIFAIVSIYMSYSNIDEKYSDTALVAMMLVSFIIDAVAIIAEVNISEFTPESFYLDYWYLVSFGLAAILTAFPVGYMGYLISKKKEA